MGRANRKSSAGQENLRDLENLEDKELLAEDAIGEELLGEGDSGEEASEELPGEEVSEEEVEEALEGVPLQSLPLHLRAIGKFELLSPEQEKMYARRAEAGDKRAKDMLIQSNLRLVVAVAKKYQGHGIELIDLIQDGSIGLIRAAEKFDYRRKLRFSTYATWWIRQSIVRSIDDRSRSVRIPVHVAEKIHKLRSGEAKLAAKLGREPLPAELAQALEWPEEDVLEIRRLRDQRTVSLDKPLGDEDGGTLGDVIPDDSDPLEEAHIHLRAENIRDLLEILPEREKEVLAMRHGLDGQTPKTLAECGEELQLSRERVRQIESSAHKRISLMPEAQALKEE